MVLLSLLKTANLFQIIICYKDQAYVPAKENNQLRWNMKQIKF